MGLGEIVGFDSLALRPGHARIANAFANLLNKVFGIARVWCAAIAVQQINFELLFRFQNFSNGIGTSARAGANREDRGDSHIVS